MNPFAITEETVLYYICNGCLLDHRSLNAAAKCCIDKTDQSIVGAECLSPNKPITKKALDALSHTFVSSW